MSLGCWVQFLIFMSFGFFFKNQGRQDLFVGLGVRCSFGFSSSSGVRVFLVDFFYLAVRGSFVRRRCVRTLAFCFLLLSRAFRVWMFYNLFTYIFVGGYLVFFSLWFYITSKVFVQNYVFFCGMVGSCMLKFFKKLLSGCFVLRFIVRGGEFQFFFISIWRGRFFSFEFC